ncbi:mechanosensitive ion channel family protein [Halopelagius longus]|uniref:Mechanosensitive ion channel family protein n=1 Tax=Halopelagius longus TaxID=1236180 RepID=A0A1H0Z3Y5_9EURY|nr:mechanosensitive ion channel family protein [Halopelagius longus]RDI72807.1 mechanosensitive ion channel family protein [Halopelagius longus]SDQ21841.1 Small-conductance mechanosensitive channel [Halopelagius longus]
MQTHTLTTAATEAAESGLLALPRTFVPSLTGRVAVTVAVVAVVTFVLGRTNRFHDLVPPWIPATVWHVGVTLATMAVTVGGALLLVGVWGFSAQLVEVYEQYRFGRRVVVQLALSGLLLVSAYAVTGLVHQLTDEVAQSQPNVSDHQREVIYRLAQLTVYFVTAVVVLGVWNADLGGLLVGAGFLGIVVGMAARQTLGALIAGFVLMFSRPFEIGDWIEVGEHEGIVTDITVVNTRIQSFDGEYVMVPNDVISGETLVNRSRKGRLRIEVEVGVDYDVDPNHAAEVAQAAVDELEDVLSVPSPQVVLKEFGDSAVLLGVRAWIDRPSARRKWRTQTAIVGAVKEAFDREGIKIPYPQQELMAREEKEGFVLAGGEGPAPDADEDAPRDQSHTRAADGRGEES